MSGEQCWTGILVTMEILGVVLTLGGLIALFVGARSRYRVARAQLDRALDLNIEEAAEREAAQDVAQELAIADKYRELHRQNGLPRPAGYGESYQPGYETVTIMRALGNGALRDLILASAGLLLSAAASVISLLTTASTPGA